MNLTKPSTYLQEWKDEMTRTIRLKYSKEKLSDKDLERYLDNKIIKAKEPPMVLIVNNYTHKMSRINILDLIDLIRRNNLICTGGGCIFLPHNVKRNILIDFIQYIMAGRKAAKKKRSKFDKGTDEWEEADREQLAFKLIINSLYGCMGYPGFILFNIFIAEAITNQGRQIITSAINCIENFMGDSMLLENPIELYHFIHTLDVDFQKSTGGEYLEGAFEMLRGDLDINRLPETVSNRFLSKCTFTVSNETQSNIRSIFAQMNQDELLYMYYKNNLLEFSRLPFMKAKIKSLIIDNGPLQFCEDYSYKDDSCRNKIAEIIKFYEYFVNYNHPIYDRVRKAMYYDKTNSLYTDTDSVFISLNEMVQYMLKELFKSPEESGQNHRDLRFTSANITLSIVNRMIDLTMKKLCYSCNITEEYAKLLAMKNEFFFSRIMFSNVKKRYISLAMLQEGQILGGGEGLPEIKGYDFIKAGTKPFIRDYYTKICLEDILYPENVNPVKIFKKISDFRTLMNDMIKNGSMELFKQANVKRVEYYKNPYSTQGVVATILWNTLCPDKAVELPSDTNIAPIKSLQYPKPPKPKEGSPINRSIEKSPLEYKNIKWYAEKHPEAYKRLCKGIYLNQDSAIRHMNLSSIAIPKNLDYKLPDYVVDLLDSESVINTALNLILPIMKCIGINSYKVNTNTEYMSNMVEI